jgi:hypothetical protein
MKNKMSHSFGLVLFTVILVFSGCSKNSDNPVEPNNIITAEANLTLNGAGYTDKAVTLSNGVGGYSVSDSSTALVFSGKSDNDSLYLYIVFKGNHTGTFNWDQNNSSILYKYSSTGNNIFLGVQQGTTTISSYGAVGAKVEGTLSGKLIEITSQAELNISGSFSAVRIQDAQ